MAKVISEQTLFEGSWHALAQAGRLLRSSVTLYKDGDYGSALALAMFGREELGRSRLLRDCAQEVASGEQLEAREINRLCGNHVEKQQASNFGTTLRTHTSSSLGKALTERSKHELGPGQRGAASDAVAAAADAKSKRQPHDRHQARCGGLYVDLNDAGDGWECPVDIEQESVYHGIVEAANDYAQELDRLTNCELWPHLPAQISAADMGQAREDMVRDVELPQPVFPPPLAT